MEIYTYEQLANEIKRLQSENARLTNERAQLAGATLSPDDRARREQSYTDRIRNVATRLNDLLVMERAYNTMLDNIRTLRNIDVENAPNRETVEEMVDNLRNETIEARTHLSEGLQQEIRDRFQIGVDDFENTFQQENQPIPTQQTNTTPNQTAPTNTAPTATAPATNTTTPPANSETETETVNFIDEYRKISSEYDAVLGERTLTEVGLRDFDSIRRRYIEIRDKKKKLLEDSNVDLRTINSAIDMETLREILNNNHEFDERIERDLKEIESLKEEKTILKESFEAEIQDLQKGIEAARFRIAELENLNNQLIGNPLNKALVDKNSEEISKLKDAIFNDEKEIQAIKADIKALMNGGKIRERKVNEKPLEEIAIDEITDIKEEEQTKEEDKPKGEEKPKEEKPEEKPKEEEKPKDMGTTPGGPTGMNGPASGAMGRPGGMPGGPALPPELPDTLEGLKQKGVLPRDYTEKELLEICKALNIDVKDMNTVLSKEHIERLTSDHQIQSAMINQRIYDRTARKIAEYDSLIAKYESILKDRMKHTAFSDEYIEKVETLVDKLKAEQATLRDKNMKVISDGRGTLAKGIASLSNKSLDARATNKNEKIRKAYDKLDDLKREKAEASSKFKQRKQDKRIARVLKRIEKLKEKKATIVSKQTQIINEKSDEYIERMTAKIQKHVARQANIEQNVNAINAIADRIEQTNAERNRIAMDKQKENRLFDRIGMAFEDRKLESQLSNLEVQRDIQDFVGRHK